MDSLSKEQLFDTIIMAIHHGYYNTARYLFYDALSLVRENTIEDCINLAIKKDADYLVKDIEKIQETHSATD